jgi:hypothetical protein
MINLFYDEFKKLSESLECRIKFQNQFERKPSEVSKELSVISISRKIQRIECKS